MKNYSREDGLMLIEASENGDAETVKLLLAKGVYIHCQDKNGRCPVVAAAYNNRLETAALLINAGADVNMKDDTIQSAYLITTAYGDDGYLELLEMTLKAGADIHGTDSYNGTGLIRACDRGYVSIVKRLLETDIRIDHINNIGWTALHETVILGGGDERHTEIVRMLVAAGADTGIPDRNGVTALEHAVNRNYNEMIKILERV